MKDYNELQKSPAELYNPQKNRDYSATDQRNNIFVFLVGETFLSGETTGWSGHGNGQSAFWKYTGA